MNKAVYHEIVIPLFEMRNACLICISSPLGQFNFYSALIALKDPRTGLSVIDSYHLKLVCDRCIKKEHPEHCIHEKDKIPPWKSSDKLDIVKMIMEASELYGGPFFSYSFSTSLCRNCCNANHLVLLRKPPIP